MNPSQSNKVEFEYYYLIFGIKIHTDLKKFNSDLNQDLIIPKNEDIIKFTTFINFLNGNNHAKFKEELNDMIHNSTAWIYGKFKASIESIESREVLQSPYLKPPELIEEALHLLGHSTARVIHICKSIDFWRLIVINISNGLMSISAGGFRIPIWIHDDFIKRWHTDEEIWINNDHLEFINKFSDFRFKDQSNIQASIIFGRFEKMIKENRLFEIILESMIILEVLLIERLERKGSNLKKRISKIIGRNERENNIINSVIKSLYNMRSKIVHEGKFHVGDLFNNKMKSRHIGRFVIDLVRLILLRFIFYEKRFYLPSKSNRIKILENHNTSEILPYFSYGLNDFWDKYHEFWN